MKKTLIALSTVVIMLATTSLSLACACCAEHGYRYSGLETVNSSRSALLKEMDMEAEAVLYTDAAGFESIRGLDAIKAEYEDGSADSIGLVDAFTGNIWKITLKTPAGKSATLTLPRPSRMNVSMVDQHQVEVGAGEAILYKEFRFDGNVGRGTGFLTSSRAAKYSLVFQGKGNMCDSSSDFSHWRLEVTGPKADYAFFGKLKA